MEHDEITERPPLILGAIAAKSPVRGVVIGGLDMLRINRYELRY